MFNGAAQDGHGCGLEVKWRESLHAKGDLHAYAVWVSLFEHAPTPLLAISHRFP